MVIYHQKIAEHEGHKMNMQIQPRRVALLSEPIFLRKWEFILSSKYTSSHLLPLPFNDLADDLIRCCGGSVVMLEELTRLDVRELKRHQATMKLPRLSMKDVNTAHHRLKKYGTQYYTALQRLRI